MFACPQAAQSFGHHGAVGQRGAIKIAIVPLYFTTTDQADVDAEAIKRSYSGGDATGADSTFARWWREASFGRQGDIDLDVLDAVPVNLPEWVDASDAEQNYNLRVSTDACKAEIAAFEGYPAVGFASYELLVANSVCHPSADCVRPTWKWDYAACGPRLSTERRRSTAPFPHCADNIGSDPSQCVAVMEMDFDSQTSRLVQNAVQLCRVQSWS